ncbi:MAG: NAD(P)H-dependent oxidoreductase [Sarcina sp.]
MKKILYISVNSKEECDSASKTVARALIDEVLSECRYRIPRYKDHNHNIDEECCDIPHHHHHHNICCDEHHHHHHYDNERCEGKYEHGAKNECCEGKHHHHHHFEEKCCDEHEKFNISNEDTLNEGINTNVDKKEELIAQQITNDILDENQAEETLKEKAKEYYEKIKDNTCCEEKSEQECNSKENKCCEADEECDSKESKCCESDKKNNDEWEECNDFIVEEVDLYKDYIPVLTHEFFKCKNTLVDGVGPCCDSMSEEKKKDLDRIRELAYQFKEADVYIIAAPVWSLLFPAPLKQYLDCVILNGITAKISKHECRGLLNDKERKMIFVQSVGGELPMLLRCKLDYSTPYLKDISKFLGISKFMDLLVDGTGYTECEKRDAINEALKDVPSIARRIIK